MHGTLSIYSLQVKGGSVARGETVFSLRDATVVAELVLGVPCTGLVGCPPRFFLHVGAQDDFWLSPSSGWGAMLHYRVL